MDTILTKTNPDESNQETSSPRHGEKLRVCHLSMTLLTGGLERLLVDYGRFHDSEQFELSFLALEELGPPADDLRADGFDVDTVMMSKIGKWAGIRQLKKILIERKIDVLHTHNTYPYFYGALAAKLAGVRPVVNSQHGRGCGGGMKALWQFRLANRLSDRVAGVSEDATRMCQEQDRGSAKKMMCIWNGIDLDRFQYHGPQDELTAISVARLSPEKDFGTLLRAVRIVVDQYPEFRLKMVGDGSERNHLEQLCTELGLTEQVEFLGERKDVPELLRSAGFFVSSSKTEGISLTLLEAMAVGLPIVTTDVGGNPEIVIPNRTGKLCPSQQPQALAQRMLEMIEERSVWPEIGRTARERVEKHFNIRTMIGEYEKLYLELVGKKSRS